MSERKMIHATATSGPALAICPQCRKVVGPTRVVLSMPFYPDLGNDTVPLSSTPEMLSIEFEPVEHCLCNAQPVPKYQRGDRVQCETQGITFTGSIAQLTIAGGTVVYHIEAETPNGRTTPVFVEEREIVGLATEEEEAGTP